MALQHQLQLPMQGVAQQCLVLSLAGTCCSSSALLLAKQATLLLEWHIGVYGLCVWLLLPQRAVRLLLLDSLTPITHLANLSCARYLRLSETNRLLVCAV